jgi:hypothetical protein
LLSCDAEGPDGPVRRVKQSGIGHEGAQGLLKFTEAEYLATNW